MNLFNKIKNTFNKPSFTLQDILYEIERYHELNDSSEIYYPYNPDNDFINQIVTNRKILVSELPDFYIIFNHQMNELCEKFVLEWNRFTKEESNKDSINHILGSENLNIFKPTTNLCWLTCGWERFSNNELKEISEDIKIYFNNIVCSYLTGEAEYELYKHNIFRLPYVDYLNLNFLDIFPSKSIFSLKPLDLIDGKFIRSIRKFGITKYKEYRNQRYIDFSQSIKFRFISDCLIAIPKK